LIHFYKRKMLSKLSLAGKVNLRPAVRLYSRTVLAGSQGTSGQPKVVNEDLAVNTAADVSSVNSRLETLSLTGSYFSAPSLLTGHSPDALSTQVKLPTLRKKEIVSPLPDAAPRKTYIQEIKPEVCDPQKVVRIEEPIVKRIKKHLIRMVILRRKKMRKHRRKRLLDRMYLKFRANKLAATKRKELEFRGRLSDKVTEARKFSVEEYVSNYLQDFHTPLIPGTYKGKRLPQWLIMELMEEDKLKEKERNLEGKMYTTKEDIVKSGETVDQFIQRTWK